MKSVLLWYIQRLKNETSNMFIDDFFVCYWRRHVKYLVYASFNVIAAAKQLKFWWNLQFFDQIFDQSLIFSLIKNELRSISRFCKCRIVVKYITVPTKKKFLVQVKSFSYYRWNCGVQKHNILFSRQFSVVVRLFRVRNLTYVYTPSLL